MFYTASYQTPSADTENQMQTISQQVASNTLFHLPKWITLQMVYPNESVERKGILGCGQYGIVQKGVVHQGGAV